MDLVSILIPVYNREKYIKATILSALAQTHSNVEIIVVDNASTDNTWDLIQELSNKNLNVKSFRNDNNIGPVKNWQRCIDEASGYYGKILWSDDLIDPTFLEKTIPLLGEDVGFVYTGTEVFFDNGEAALPNYFIGNTGSYPSNVYIDGVLFKNNFPVSPGCALFRLNDLKRNLLIDVPNKVGSDFSIHGIGSDLLIFLLCAHQYKKFAVVDEKLSYFRSHEDSITVSVNDAKLTLFYRLAMSYFSEIYRRDLIKKMNATNKISLIKYYDSSKYGFTALSDFYIKNKNFSIDYVLFTRKIISFFLRRMLKASKQLKLAACLKRN